jgi:hypothetical protein
MVQEVFGVTFPTDSTIGAIAAEVHNNIYVPSTLLTERGDFVYSCLIRFFAWDRQLTLFVLCQEGMSAVSLGYRGHWWSSGIVLRRCTRQEVAASSLFESRVIGEEVLEQPRRCLACTEPWLAWPVKQAQRHCTGRHSR